ncbi:MAG: TadE family protein [Nitrospirota bacterium]
MKRKRVSERGSALVEMAVILPILVLLIHGIFYFGRGYVNKEKVEMAARFAAWEKIARPGDTVEMVKDAITEKYFRGETIQLRYISDQEECRNAARAAAGGSAGTGEAIDAALGILSGIGGLQCAEVKYTYNPAPWGIPTYELPSRPQPLFSPIEVKAVHAVLGDYYSVQEHRDRALYDPAGALVEGIKGLLGFD